MGTPVAEWCDDSIYQQISDEMLFDPLPPAPNPLDLTDPASRPDGSWCEDRAPATAGGPLTDVDGRE
jgi:hypothetical protein